VRKYAVVLVFLLVASGCSLKGNVFYLSVGDCYNDDPLTYEVSEVGDVDVVSCSKPHTYEVYSEFELTGSSFPGQSTVISRADEGCFTRFASFVGIEYDYSEWYYSTIFPTKDSWNNLDDRQVTCILGTEYDELTTGSARGTRR
tara:strand:- start:565 stop:996 length:432 start_codon:yes stop_codon:yes gene_type:complete